MKHSKSDILEGGIELFRKYGYEGTGIQQILKSLNIPKGSFYNYFKSKEDFVIESIDLYSASGLENHRKLLTDKSKSPLKRIKSILDTTQKQYISESFEKSCLLDMLATEICGNNNSIANQIDAVYEKRKLIYADCIKEGQEVGEIRKDEVATNLAEFLLTGYSGAQLKAKTEKSIRPMKDYSRQYIKYITA